MKNNISSMTYRQRIEYQQYISHFLEKLNKQLGEPKLVQKVLTPEELVKQILDKVVKRNA